MGMDRRRTGFRLSWTANDKQGEDDPQHDEAANDAAPAAVDTMIVDAPSGEMSDPKAPALEASSDEAPEAARETPATAPTPDGESSEFLVSLVGAMRGVAESSRDASLADLRTAVDAHIEQLNTTSAEKDTELRRAADLDLQGVGDWERDEIERIKGEAETRRDARRTRLEQQLAEHRAASEREVEASRARLADHERELAAFFAQLAEITDPAAFVAAAKRMPRAPELDSTAPPVAAAAPEVAAPEKDSAVPGDDPRLAAMGAMADSDSAGATATATAEAQDDPPADAAATPEMGDSSTDNRLAARLAQLDQRIASGTQPVAAAAPASANGGGPPPLSSSRGWELRRHHQLQAGAGARRRRARRDAVARSDGRVRLPREPRGGLRHGRRRSERGGSLGHGRGHRRDTSHPGPHALTFGEHRAHRSTPRLAAPRRGATLPARH